MEPLVQMDVAVTPKDYRQAMSWCFVRGPQRFLFILWAIICVLVLLNVFWVVDFKRDPTVLVSPFVFVFLIPVLAFWGINRHFSKLPSYLKQGHWQFFDDRIEIANRLSDARMSWDIFVRIAETRWSFLFLLNSQSLLILPKRCLSSANDLAAIRNQIQMHGGKAG